MAYQPEPETEAGPDFGALHAHGAAAIVAHQDGTRYFDIHHSAEDTIDKVDAAALQQNVAVYAAFAWMAANAAGDFGSR